MPFDPDQYLATKAGGAPQFDPDAFLSKRGGGTAIAEPEPRMNFQAPEVVSEAPESGVVPLSKQTPEMQGLLRQAYQTRIGQDGRDLTQRPIPQGPENAPPQFKGEEFLTNPIFNPPGALLKSSVEGVRAGGEQIASSIEEANRLSEKDQNAQAFATATLGTAAGALKAGFGAATPFLPELAAFTAGGELAAQVPSEGFQKGLQTIQAPIQTLLDPKTLAGKSAAEIGDLLYFALAAKGVHQLTASSIRNKITNGEPLAPGQMNILRQQDPGFAKVIEAKQAEKPAEATTPEMQHGIPEPPKAQAPEVEAQSVQPATIAQPEGEVKPEPIQQPIAEAQKTPEAQVPPTEPTKPPEIARPGASTQPVSKDLARDILDEYNSGKGKVQTIGEMAQAIGDLNDPRFDKLLANYQRQQNEYRFENGMRMDSGDDQFLSGVESIVGAKTEKPTAKAEPAKAELGGLADPWSMSRDKYIGQLMMNADLSNGKHITPQQIAEARADHGKAVKKALAEGEPVPSEVLKDYPDLEKQQPSTPVSEELPKAYRQKLIDEHGGPEFMTGNGKLGRLSDRDLIDYVKEQEASTEKPTSKPAQEIPEELKGRIEYQGKGSNGNQEYMITDENSPANHANITLEPGQDLVARVKAKEADFTRPTEEPKPAAVSSTPEEGWKPYTAPGKEAPAPYLSKALAEKRVAKLQAEGKDARVVPWSEKSKSFKVEYREKAAEAKAKEPWGMTRSEYKYAENKPLVDAIHARFSKGGSVILATNTKATRLTRPEHIRVTPKGDVQVVRGKAWDTLTQDQVHDLATQAGVKIPEISEQHYHGELVRAAVAEGKPVPHEVLKDYPDLAGKKAEPEVAKTAEPGTVPLAPTEPDHLNRMPDELRSTVKAEAKSMIGEVKNILTSKGGIGREDSYEGKAGGGAVVSRFGATSTAPEWFKELGRSKEDVLKNLQKIVEDNPQNALALRLIDSIVEMKNKGRFERGYEAIPADEEFSSMYDAYRKGEWDKFKDATSFDFKLESREAKKAPKKPVPQEEMFTSEQKGQAAYPRQGEGIRSGIPLSEQVKGTMFEPEKPKEEGLFDAPKNEPLTRETVKDRLLNLEYAKPDEVEGALALWDAKAKAMGMSTDDWIHKYIAGAKKGEVPDGALAQNAENAPTFYSGLQRLIDQKMPAKASAEQVRNIIRDAKKDEVVWTGLDDYLKDHPRVTKQEITDFLKQNEVKVEEVVNHENRHDTKFSGYVLPGAKEGSYRELKLTLPVKDELPPGFEVIKIGNSWGIRFPDGKQIGGWSTRQDAIESQGRQPGSPVFRSGHFDEPNILAHVRFNERTDAQGKKTLFIEEIQSDWHEKGRKQGYVGGQPEIYEESPNRWRIKGWDLSFGSKESALETWKLSPSHGDQVPNAPFKTSWPELAVKRMIRWAAENGYDKIAWTKGEQQAARYDLSKQVRELLYKKNTDGTYDLGVTQRAGDTFQKIASSISAEKIEDYVGKDVARKITDGINFKKATQSGQLSGLDLKVGGEGMKGFYDQIIPSIADKLGKKFGAKVADVEIGNTGESVGKYNYVDPETGMPSHAPGAIRQPNPNYYEKFHSLDITPAMRESAISVGFPLFQEKKGAVSFIADGKAVIHALNAPDVSTLAHETGHIFRRQLDGPDLKIAEQWAGVKDGIWQESHEEKFARGFERYLADGKAPTPALQKVFQQFKEWLSNIYQSIKGSAIDVKVSKEMRGVFDRMLSEEETGLATGENQVPKFAMGAASAKEFLPEKEFTTSIKNKAVDAEREARGLPPAMQAASRSFGTVWDEAMRKVEENQELTTELVAELKEKPRALTDTEDALLLHRQIDLQNDYEKAMNRLNEAQDRGDQEAVVENRARVAKLSDDLLDVYSVGKSSGAESGRGLNARKMLAKEDFTLAQMMTEKRAANNGKPLTPEQEVEIKRLNEKITSLQKKVDEYEANRQKQEATEQAKATTQKLNEEVKEEKETEARTGRKRDAGKEKDAILAGLKRAQAEKLPLRDLGPYIQRLAKNFIRQGVMEREPLIDAVHKVLSDDIIPDITRRETMDAISGYGDFKELSKDAVTVRLREMKGEMQQLAKLEDITQRQQAPLKTGVERRTPTDEERRLIQQVNSAKKKYGIQTVDPERQLKSALDSVKTRLKNQIADLEFQISTGEKIVREKSGLEYDEEAKGLKAQRDELKTQYDEIFGKPEMSDERRLAAAKLAVARSITEYERRIKENDLNPKPRAPGVIETPELAALRARRDAVKAEFKQLQSLANPKKTPEEIALEALKTRLATRIAELHDRLQRGDFAPKPQRRVALDRHAMILKADAERAKQDYRRGLVLDRMKNRTRTEKIADTFLKWRRGFILSGVVTLAKLTSAAAERMAFSAAEEVIGSGISRFVPDVAARAPREGGLNVTAESRALTEGFTKGMEDAWQTLKTGHSDLDVLYGKKLDLPRSAVDFFGSLHGALKAQAKRNEFTRSFEKRVAFAIKSGVDATDPMVQTRLAVEAYKDANRAIFMQDNRVVSAYKRFVGALEEKNKDTGKPPLGGKFMATTARLLLPIVKVPTNIVAETIQYSTGMITGSVRLARAMHKGVSSLSPEEADLIMRNLKKGSIGSAFLLVGFFSPESIGGFYQPGKRDEGDVKPGGVRLFGMDIPKYLVHNPLLETLQIGSTIRRVADSKFRKKDMETQGIGAGLMAGGLGLIDEVPFIRESVELGKALDPKERPGYFGELAKSVAVPQLVQWLATMTDKNDKGETVKRNPGSVLEHVETGIPGLRQNVPVKAPKPVSLHPRQPSFAH